MLYSYILSFYELNLVNLLHMIKKIKGNNFKVYAKTPYPSGLFLVGNSGNDRFLQIAISPYLYSVVPCLLKV